MNVGERDELLGRVDERTLAIKEMVDSNSDKLDQHNGDIQALKQWQAKLTGAFCVLAAVVVFFQTEIAEVVTHVLGG